MNVRAIIGFALLLVAALFLVAGSPAIGIMPRNVANFAGIAVACVAVLTWVIYGATARQTPEEKEEETKG
jgi:drug/metabolite transporter (DMT)-like permease